MSILAAVLLVLIVLPAPAAAQIYSWRDGSGRLVVSNLPKVESAGVVTYPAGGPGLIRTTVEPPRGPAVERYNDLIQHHARAFGVSPDLVRAVIQAESAFNPLAVSPKGAMGLMQLMPATAQELGVRDPFHPPENIRGGVTYLARLLTRYNQNVELALAAYNAGPASVERYGTVPPYRETQAYVRKITQVTRSAPPTVPGIYKWREERDGKIVVRYSNLPPPSGSFEIVGRR
ncbi:MAG: lytic transglycosylase domain-containing protein [Acidobacteriota bacterium]